MSGCLAASGRVAPREVLAAYEQTGLRPTFGEWYVTALISGPSFACALTAVAKQKGWNDPERLMNGYAASKVLEGRMPRENAGIYREGFAKGFDGTIQRRDWPYERAEWMGYRDGQRARAFVKARLLEDG